VGANILRRSQKRARVFCSELATSDCRCRSGTGVGSITCRSFFYPVTYSIPATSHKMALVAYRTLLRSARIAFQGTSRCNRKTYRHSQHSTGDLNTFSAARAEARKHFESNRNLRVGSEELEKSLVHAEEVGKFLRENVVQGQAAGADSYSTWPHAMSAHIIIHS
jgi:complex III assembly factor LYRM7